MTEGTNADRAEAIAEERLHREHVGRRLCRAVGRDGPKRGGLGDREIGVGDLAVLLGAQHDHDAGDTEIGRRAQHVERALGVDAERRCWRLPAVANVAERGQVVHHLGVRVAEPLADVVGVGDLERIRTGPVERDDLVAAGLEVGDEVRADESECAGDDRLHAATPAAIR